MKGYNWWEIVIIIPAEVNILKDKIFTTVAEVSDKQGQSSMFKSLQK